MSDIITNVIKLFFHRILDRDQKAEIDNSEFPSLGRSALQVTHASARILVLG